MRNLIAFGCVAALAAACGSKNSGSSAPAAPETITTTVTDTTVNGSTVTIHYKSSLPTAAFKCQTIVSGQPAPTTWTDCPTSGTTVALTPGAQTTFRVMAVDPATGVQDQSPPSYQLAGGGAPVTGPQGPGAPQGDGFTTVITNKSTIVSPVTTDHVELHFGVSGGPQLTMDQLSFQCKRGTDTVFRPCGDASGVLTVSLTDGQQVNLQVEAVDDATGETAIPDSISFTVATGGLSIGGTTNPQGQALASATTGTFQLTFNQAPDTPTGARTTCQLNQVGSGQPQPISAAADCSQGYALNLTNLAPGSYSLAIQTVGPDNTVVGTKSLNFCAHQCSAASITGGAPVVTGGTNQGPAQVGPQPFLLGGSYQLNVPVGMHVTEYATNTVAQAAEGLWRVTTDSDPTYIGNYACTGTFDQKLTFPSPSGQQLNYCNTTPPNQQWMSFMTGNRIADNHIEVSTDYAPNPQTLNIVDFNVFDSAYAYRTGRSRFEKLCANHVGAITVIQHIPFQVSFFGEPVLGTFLMCNAPLVIPQGNGLPVMSAQLWQNTAWIGGLFFETTNGALPSPECFDRNWQLSTGGRPSGYVPNYAGCSTYTNSNLLEMTWVSKTPYPDAAFFAQQMQQWLGQNLQQARPLMPAN